MGKLVGKKFTLETEKLHRELAVAQVLAFACLTFLVELEASNFQIHSSHSMLFILLAMHSLCFIGLYRILFFWHVVPSVDGPKMKGNTIGYIFSGASPVGIFCLSDACRTGAAEAVNQLKSLGIRTAMLTGDNQAAAMQAQEQVHFKSCAFSV